MSSSGNQSDGFFRILGRGQSRDSQEKMVSLLRLTQLSVLSPAITMESMIVPIIATIFDPGLNSPDLKQVLFRIPYALLN